MSGSEAEPHAAGAGPGRLVIRMLGGLDLRRDGAPLVVGGALKAMALFAYLACTRRPQAREVLAELLWDDRGPQQGQANLRQLLTRLDPQLLPALQITRATLAFNPAYPHWLDVAAFDEKIGAARAALAPGAAGEDRAAAVAALEEAVALYRGPFLDGLAVRECRGFEDWMLGEQQRLERAVLQALHTLVRYHLDQGTYGAGIPCARRLVELDPVDEAAHRALMRLLAYSGQRTAALEQYAACERICQVELGVAPSSETTALYARIQAEALDVVAAARPAGGRARPQLLPVPLTPFVGREREVAEILAHLSSPATRLVVLTGPAGSGKTRLALHAAQMSTGFPAGVYFAPLAGVTGSTPLAGAILAALQQAVAPRADTRSALLAYLRGKDLLLVLDGWEGGRLGLDLLGDIIRQGQQRVTLLLTARDPLPLDSAVVIDTTAFAMPALLLAQIAEADDDGRAAIYAALAQLRASTPVAIHEPAVLAALHAEVLGAYRLAVLRADLGPAAHDPLLGEALAGRAERGRDRIRMLLGILDPVLDRAPDIAPDPGRLVAVVGAYLAELLAPLLAGDAAAVVALGARRLDLPRLPMTIRLSELAQHDDAWLRACALFCSGSLGVQDLAPIAQAALADPDALVRETALATCRALLEPAVFQAIALTQAAAAPGSLPTQYARAVLRAQEAL